MDNFNIAEWKYNRLITENQQNEKVDMNGLKSIYDYLIKRLREPAEEAGLRMSIFEQEFPTASGFMIEYDKGTEGSALSENINNNLDKIEIIHNERNGKIYKIKVWVDGKEERPSTEELNNLISSTIGEEVSIPTQFNPEQFRNIEDKLLAQDIEVDYNDNMDVS